MTAPELNAIRNAGFRPLCAAVAVLEFPRTAMFMPMKPANADPMAPAKYERAVHGPCSSTRPIELISVIFASSRTFRSMNSSSTTNMATTNIARIVYSRRKKADAPSRISPAISRTVSFPSSFRRTSQARKAAVTRATAPDISPSAIEPIQIFPSRKAFPGWKVTSC